MTEFDALQARLDALEIRVAYQDQTIEDLNAAITGQWKQIEALNRDLDRLREELREAERAAETSTEPEPPPPHY